MARIPTEESVPCTVVDALVTCVAQIEGKKGASPRRCRKPRMEGFDFCPGRCRSCNDSFCLSVSRLMPNSYLFSGHLKHIAILGCFQNRALTFRLRSEVHLWVSLH